VETVRAAIRKTIIELDWLKKKAYNMLIATDWPSMLVDRGEKVTSFKLTSMILQSHTWTPGIVVFVHKKPTLCT
jgi:hypothetical protein